MRVRGPRVSPGPPSASPSSWDSPNKLGSLEWEGPRSGTGRPPPPTARQRAGAGRTVPRRPAPAGPAPAAAPPSPLERARRRHREPSATRLPAPPTSERPAGPWGRPRAGSRSFGGLDSPRGPEAPALPASGPWAAAAFP